MAAGASDPPGLSLELMEPQVSLSDTAVVATSMQSGALVQAGQTRCEVCGAGCAMKSKVSLGPR